MAKSLKLRAFPEEITEEGIKIYGETSYENQIAVLSHYLHNSGVKVTKKRKEEIISSVREFLSRKQFRQGMTSEELSDEEIWKVAEDATQYDLFSDFFEIPFPAPENPKFTFIDLFAGIGGFRIAMRTWVANASIHPNSMLKHRNHISLIMVKCHLETSLRNQQKAISRRDLTSSVVAFLAKHFHLQVVGSALTMKHEELYSLKLKLSCGSISLKPSSLKT